MPLLYAPGIPFRTSPGRNSKKIFPWGNDTLRIQQAASTKSLRRDMCRKPGADDFSGARGGWSYPLSNEAQGWALVVGLAAVAFSTAAFDSTATTVRLRDLATLYALSGVVRKSYNAYLEAAYFAYPGSRTQRDAAPRSEEDVTGRTRDQVELVRWHDRMTGLSTFCLYVGAYYACGGAVYADVAAPATEWRRSYWFARVLAHHYCLSFGMYWAHRSLHAVPWLWSTIHSLHHYAKVPLARTTYMDHWADNFGNAIISEVLAPILVPLPFPVLAASRLFRVCESLEKHSGLSGAFNVVHTAQRWLPFAQMPHHHDWHHEGHKGCNYTFCSLGGASFAHSTHV